jgi:hypothetical protein
MEGISMPADHSEVKFIDNQGIERKGIYRKVLKAFVETDNGKDIKDDNNRYSEDNIIEWKYIHHDKNPDSDLMIIL